MAAISVAGHDFALAGNSAFAFVDIRAHRGYTSLRLLFMPYSVVNSLTSAEGAGCAPSVLLHRVVLDSWAAPVPRTPDTTVLHRSPGIPGR